MLKRFLTLTLCFTPLVCFAAKPSAPQFSPLEHIFLGDQIKLSYTAKSPGIEKVPLTLANGLNLTYGEIIALAGDFYGDIEKPISFGKNDTEKKQRFSLAFASLAASADAYTEATNIKNSLIEEKKLFQQFVDEGEAPVTVLKRLSVDNNITWSCLTGGMCAAEHPEISPDVFRKIYYLQPGRYLQLRDNNFDHFADNAWQTYHAGHQVALEIALKAGQDHNLNKLTEAYAVNAFASHYLADEFSAGHIRTPRIPLSTVSDTPTMGSLLSTYMHNEDDEIGLTVTNQVGDRWTAYGDHYFFEPKNDKNQALLLRALQASADEIFSAYSTGNLPETDNVKPLVPFLVADNQKPNSHVNSAPLFYWDEKTKKLMCRNDIEDPYNYEWTADWSPWQILLQLVQVDGDLYAMDKK